jgi:hypothetical protein
VLPYDFTRNSLVIVPLCADEQQHSPVLEAVVAVGYVNKVHPHIDPACQYTDRINITVIDPGAQ